MTGIRIGTRGSELGLWQATEVSKKLRMVGYHPEIGTSSPRRRAQLIERYPHLKIEPIRGNVSKRIDTMRAGSLQDASLTPRRDVASQWRPRHSDRCCDPLIRP